MGQIVAVLQAFERLADVKLEDDHVMSFLEHHLLHSTKIISFVTDLTGAPSPPSPPLSLRPSTPFCPLPTMQPPSLCPTSTLRSPDKSFPHHLR